MPENPEVRIIAQKLNEALDGKILNNITFSKSSKHSNLPVERLCLPIKLIRVESKGKLLIFVLNNNIYITSNLGYGCWVFEETLISTVNFTFDDTKLYFKEPNVFGRIDFFFNEKDFQIKLKKIGIDILQSIQNHTVDNLKKVWVSSFKNKRLNKRQICKHLLDQKYFSGIGNYLKCDILYSCKINPQKLIKDLTEEEILKLFDSAITLISESYKLGGLTINDYTDPFGTAGNYYPRIYGKKWDEYGNACRFDTFQDCRDTYWSPAIQG